MTKIIPTQYLKDTLKLKENIEGSFIMLGERLYKIKQDKIWEGSYNSFSEFLQDMGMTDGHVSKLVQIYVKFVMKYGMKQAELAQIGVRKLYAIIPLCNDKKGVSGALAQIEGLSSADTELLVKEQEAGKHKHDDQKFVRCSICKRVKRIYD